MKVTVLEFIGRSERSGTGRSSVRPLVFQGSEPLKVVQGAGSLVLRLCFGSFKVNFDFSKARRITPYSKL